MIKLKYLSLIFFALLLITNNCMANSKKHESGKPVYCDTSAGRSVLNNGSYSKLYCRYKAIMNYQSIHTCCSWGGGVLLVKQGNVICRNGTVSPVCSLQNHEQEYEQRTDNSVDLQDFHW